jgi:ketosteroid isomerase-like protein
MSQENVQAMSRMYEAWLRGDPAVFDALDREIELHPDPEAHWVGVDRTYRGHEGVMDYMRAVYEAFEDYRPEVEKFLDVGDKVVTLAIEHGRGRGSGAEVSRLEPHTSGPCGTGRQFVSTCTSIASRPSKPWGCGSRRGEFRLAVPLGPGSASPAAPDGERAQGGDPTADDEPGDCRGDHRLLAVAPKLRPPVGELHDLAAKPLQRSPQLLAVLLD